MKMVCRILPCFDFEGINYTVDLRLGEFRKTQEPYVSIKFDSEQGRVMCEYLRIIRCFNCHKWILAPSMDDSDLARCVYCGAYVDCD
jgi:hypothetical protein